MASSYRNLLATTSALIITGASAAPAFAQSAGIDEIIVTAQKREQNIQDVPIAITAFGSEYIEDRNITNISSLSSLAPNLKIENAPNNTTAAQISIRGGVTINPALTWEPTVGIYMNGAYIGKTQGSIFDVADIERVEVLRGPQGTLYGRNTLAGAINVVTQKPTGDASGSAQVGFGNYNAVNLKASQNLGQIGPVKTRLSGLIQKRDGFVDGAAGSSSNEYENVDRQGLLFSATADLNDAFTVDYVFDYSNADQKPSYPQPIVGTGTPDRADNVSTNFNIKEESKVQGHTLTAAYDFGDSVLKSITSVRQLEWEDALDLDGTAVQIAESQRLSDYDSFSQELQLTRSSNKADYVFGAYYFTDDGFTENPLFFFAPIDSEYGFDTKAWAVYGQGDFQVAEDLTLIAGLRYTSEDKSLNKTSIANGIPAGTTASESFSNLSPQVAADYKYSENVNLYAKYAKGFKSGGFNGEAGSLLDTTLPYKPEKIDSFEVGAKTNLLENTLQFNIAAFLNKHKDMQLSIFTGTSLQSEVRNAGKADIKGIEIDALWKPTDRILTRMSYGYLDTEYKEFIVLGTDVSDDRAFPQAPKNTFSLGLDADLIEGSWGDLDLSADITHSDEYYTYPYSFTAVAPQQNAANSEADSRTLLDARLAWSDIPVANQNVELAIWGKNLTDEEYLSNFIDFGPFVTGYHGAPQTYGVTLGIDW